MEEGEVCLNLSRAYYHRSDLTKAMEFSQQGLIIAKETGRKALNVTASTNLGDIYESLGNFSAAEIFFQIQYQPGGRNEGSSSSKQRRMENQLSEQT